jgi:hypothetical protein
VPTLVWLVPFSETATVGRDLDLVLRCEQIPAGSTAIDLTVPVRGARVPEPDETFGVIVVPGPGTRAGDLVGTRHDRGRRLTGPARAGQGQARQAVTAMATTGPGGRRSR